MNPTLLLLADGRFPTGGHANSAGVESAVRAGDVTDIATLERYLRARVATTGTTDAAFAAHVAAAARRVSVCDHTVATADAEYEARTPSPRLRMASRRFGRQLVRVAAPIWPCRAMDAVTAVPGGVHQPVAMGAVVAAAGGTPHDAATITLHHLVGAVTTAGVRLLGLDPMAVAGVQARVAAITVAVAAQADHTADLDAAELTGRGGTLTEILGEDHGRWGSRLFVA